MICISTEIPIIKIQINVLIKYELIELAFFRGESLLFIHLCAKQSFTLISTIFLMW